MTRFSTLFMILPKRDEKLWTFIVKLQNSGQKVPALDM